MVAFCALDKFGPILTFEPWSKPCDMRPACIGGCETYSWGPACKDELEASVMSSGVGVVVFEGGDVV